MPARQAAALGASHTIAHSRRSATSGGSGTSSIPPSVQTGASPPGSSASATARRAVRASSRQRRSARRKWRSCWKAPMRSGRSALTRHSSSIALLMASMARGEPVNVSRCGQRRRRPAKIDASATSGRDQARAHRGVERRAGLPVTQHAADLLDLFGGVAPMPARRAHRGREAVAALPGAQHGDRHAPSPRTPR